MKIEQLPVTSITPYGKNAKKHHQKRTENRMVEEKQKRRWQNLFYRKCPNCGEHFESTGKFFKCPNFHEDGNPCFFIEKLKAAHYLLDENHVAHQSLTEDERNHIEESVYGALGLDMQ